MVLLLLTPLVVYGARSSLFIHPVLIMLDQQNRSGLVTLINRGDATGSFEVSLLDYSMTTAGGLMQSDDVPAWSLSPYLRYSPRRVTLSPGESQIVKISLRPRGEVEDGEYYSHLRVLTLNDNVEAAKKVALEQKPGATAVSIASRTALTFPVIWRKGDSTPRARIEYLDVDRENMMISMGLWRLGPFSTRGYVNIYRQEADGARAQIAPQIPVIIYPSASHRVLDVKIEDAPSLARDGVIYVLYSSEKGGKGQVLAEYYLTI